MTETLLEEALLAEQEQHWLESFNLCLRALAASPEDPGTLNLLGRLCAAAGDPARAIGLQRFVLRAVPGHERAQRDLTAAMQAVRSREDAIATYEAALVIEPGIGYHFALPGAQDAFAGMADVEALLREALELDPSLAVAHAALGNVLVRRDQLAQSFAAYETAVLLDWDFAGAHLRLAALADLARDDRKAQRHLDEALKRQQLYRAADESAPRSVLMLRAPGKAIHNTPLDFTVNPSRIALHTLYLTDSEPPALPPFEVIFNAIDEADASQPWAQQASAFIAARSTRAVNHPRHLPKLQRNALRRTLRGIAGCAAPMCIRAERAGVRRLLDDPGEAGLQYPLLIRPVDTHRGDGLERLARAADGPAYLERHDGAQFFITQFVPYAGPDGFYRKYRVIVVDGRPYAYHLAISQDWLVHYVSSPMSEHAWMRDEEERFLREPQSIFAAWNDVFGAMAAAVGLEYFGVDCASDGAGGVLVFEAGPNMFVHCHDRPFETFAYKYRHVPRIFDAVERLLQ